MPYAATFALIVLAMLAYNSAAEQKARIRETVRADLQRTLATSLDLYETDLVEALDEALELATQPQDLAVYQNRLKQRFAWFDSLYVWTPPIGPNHMPQMLFPTHTGGGSYNHPCIQSTRQEAFIGPLRHPGFAQYIATAYMRRCQNAPADIRVGAAIQAGFTLYSAGLPEQALTITDLPDLRPDAPIADTHDGVSVDRRINWRLLRADIKEELGQTSQARRDRISTAYQITALDAPLLEHTIEKVPPAIELLDAAENPNAASQLRMRLASADGRLQAYRRVLQFLRHPPATQASMAPRFVRDEFADNPFMLYLRPHDDETPGVALALNQDRAVVELMRRLTSQFGDNVVIRDAAGEHVAGPDIEDAELWTPLPRSFSHLSVGLSTAYIKSKVAPLQGSSQLLTIIITTACIILGLAAIVSLNRANVRHRELLKRQRDFTARVTHELKTPLAGIKVMAENLSLGAYKSQDDMLQLTDRIIDEADRLTARVNEVLTVARDATLPNPEPFDTEEAVLDAVMQWAPRYETAGVAFQADLDATDEVLGDADAIRDAVGCLLDNALKYRCEDRAPKVQLNMRQEGRKAIIEVIDNGIGVPKGMRKEIFERWTRVEGDHRGKAGGHGLGLAQVASIVKNHKGTVKCSDGLDGGARFVITLPVVKA